MPVREGDRISFDTLESKRLISALRIARDALRARADDPVVPEDEAIESEQECIVFDQMVDVLEELEAEAYREASERFHEDQTDCS